MVRTRVNPGELLDHHRISEVLTHTPVASIFPATDVRTEQPVLVKIPQPELETNPIFSDRFQREQEIAKSFDIADCSRRSTMARRVAPTLSWSRLKARLCGNCSSQRRSFHQQGGKDSVRHLRCTGIR
jgi:hypothetical protein